MVILITYVILVESSVRITKRPGRGAINKTTCSSKKPDEYGNEGETYYNLWPYSYFDILLKLNLVLKDQEEVLLIKAHAVSSSKKPDEYDNEGETF